MRTFLTAKGKIFRKIKIKKATAVTSFVTGLLCFCLLLLLAPCNALSAGCENVDQDNDGIIDSVDNCPTVPNPKQYDPDHDSIGIVCDNVDDQDGDGITDSEDNCPTVGNPNQYDLDNDGIGLVCDTADDQDGDGIVDSEDDCLTVANPLQFDLDHDGIGGLLR